MKNCKRTLKDERIEGNILIYLLIRPAHLSRLLKISHPTILEKKTDHGLFRENKIKNNSFKII